MSKSSEVKAFARELRPHIEAELDRAEILKAMSDAAREKGIDWSQLKKLVKAQAQDACDGTDKRVVTLIEKADFAAAYADMLGFASKMSDKLGRSVALRCLVSEDGTIDAGLSAVVDELSSDMVCDGGIFALRTHEMRRDDVVGRIGRPPLISSPLLEPFCQAGD